MSRPNRILGGLERRGFSQLMSDLPYERTIIGLIALATMEGAYQITLDYVRERRAFGQAIADFQNTKFKLAEIATQIKVGRAFIDRCVEDLVAGRLDAATASMAKLWGSETQGRVLDECLQLFGGYGYMNEYLIARMYADARIQRIYGGTNEIMKEVISRAMEGLRSNFDVLKAANPADPFYQPVDLYSRSYLSTIRVLG